MVILCNAVPSYLLGQLNLKFQHFRRNRPRPGITPSGPPRAAQMQALRLVPALTIVLALFLGDSDGWSARIPPESADRFHGNPLQLYSYNMPLEPRELARVLGLGRLVWPIAGSSTFSAAIEAETQSRFLWTKNEMSDPSFFFFRIAEIATSSCLIPRRADATVPSVDLLPFSYNTLLPSTT